MEDILAEDFKVPWYAALSYCWGGPQAEATTTENIAQRSEGFASSTLMGSHTIQDSIEVARALSIPFLWIDSLCIIQDSNDDKFHEITNMGDIFASSLVTIVAKSAASANEGLMKVYERKDFGEIPYLCPDGKWGKLNLRLMNLERGLLRKEDG
jgi:hypothetical protein